MRLFKKKPTEPIRTCLFCNGTPRLTKCGDQKEYFVYLCSKCHETPVRGWDARISKLEARKVWNKRTEEAEFILNITKRVK
jgi:hypothetical protein